MSWFQRKTAGIRTPREHRNEPPEGYWRQCPISGQMVSLRELEDHHMVTEAGYHFPLSGLGYFRMLFDDGEYERHDAHLLSTDPLEFHDRKPYGKRLEAARKQSGLNDAAVSATGTVGGHPIGIAAMDFTFIGGSMGSVVGEIVTRAIRRACDQRTPLMVISQSGGARMMEGALSLMQLAKTSANLARLNALGLPYLSLMTNPTTGGVTASFAMLGDVNLAEPDALIGFAGPRVIRETIGRDLPKGFQRSEFLLEKGFVDEIVPRPRLRSTLIHLLDLLCEGEREASAPAALAASASAT
jgi:acetyl-CoA carboxylase carboxyl transferase subunit beta